MLCVAAGWAVDLFLGRPTRAHGDLEIAVPAAGFPEVAARFGGYALDAVGSGRIWPDPGPDAMAAGHQTWVRDPATGDYLVKDQADFDVTVPRLASAQRGTLAGLLAQVHPGHRWLAAL